MGIAAYQSPLLGLGEPEEDHDQSDHIETRVEAESSDGTHRRKHRWERDRKNRRPEQAGCYGPGHADFAVA